MIEEFANIVQSNCLIYYDQPLLSRSIDDKDRHWITCAVDFNDDSASWTAALVSENDLAGYLSNKLTMYQVLERSSAIYMCTGTFLEVDKLGIIAGRPIKFADIPKEDLPTTDSFLGPYAPNCDEERGT